MKYMSTRNPGGTHCLLITTLVTLLTATTTHAALLAHEPFTNAPGAAIIGSGDGFGFNGAWQANSSTGVATNTGYALGYTDAASNVLVTTGGSGFFQGSTSASAAMQPIRLFNSSRGTNGTDGVTTWISFLIARQGPTGTIPGNPYGRGANVPHDLNAGALQKLAIGNGSGATSNTVALIPQGSGANIKGSTNLFGGVTNFVVVRVDHVAGAANDNAWLFVNPTLGIEPSIADAGATSLNGFDFSFDRVRVFAGGQSSAAQPYVELIVDEYRIGETYADVTPFVTNGGPPAVTGPLLITNVWLATGGIAMSGTGGSNNGTYHLLASANLTTPSTSWPAIATNSFDANGNFALTNPILPGAGGQFFRLRITPPGPPPPVGPSITTQPAGQMVAIGQNASFLVVAEGDAPLSYQWLFNTDTPLAAATNSALAIMNVQSNHLGGYSVRVANGAGSVTSVVATLSLKPPLVAGAYFVSPTGSDSNPGTEASPFLTINKGLTAIDVNGVLYLRGGTYAQPTKLNLNKTGTTNGSIRVWAYPGEVPVVNSAGNSSDGLSISGRRYHLKGLTVMNAGHNGINISGHSNTVEFCTVRANGNTGLHITGGQSGTTFPSYNLILNCDAYLNYDPPVGENADGFSAKWDMGPGNVFRGCRAWRNSDDGWDLWMANSAVLIEDCWAFYTATNYWVSPSFDGNGNGFKLGGNYVGAPHRLLRSIAFKNLKHGIDQNNNVAGMTIDNNTSWANGAKNFYLDHNSNNAPMSGNHVVRNNLSIGGVNADTFWPGTVFTNNSWDVISSPQANNSDLQSVDESVALSPRQADGSLPVWPFLRPVPGGRLIDQGVDVGEPYAGVAPDLGAFEDGL